MVALTNHVIPGIGVARSFDCGGGGGVANYKWHAMASSETSKEEVFCGGKDIVEWKIRSRGVMLARN